jgi:hypothetical protein
VTLWSAPNYCYRMNNKAALLQVDGAGDKNYIIFEAAQ